MSLPPASSVTTVKQPTPPPDGHYYVAIKAANDSYVLLPVPMITPPTSSTILSFADPRLFIPKRCNNKYGIIAYESHDQIVQAFERYIKTGPLIKSMFDIAIRSNNKAILDIARQRTRESIFEHKYDDYKSICEDDPVTIAYKSRKWPVSAWSPESWKRLCVNQDAASSNWMIRTANMLITKAAANGTEGYTFAITDGQFKPNAGETIATYAERISTVDGMKKYSIEFLKWASTAMTNLPKKTEEMLIGFICQTLSRGASYSVPAPQKQPAIRPQIPWNLPKLNNMIRILHQLEILDDQDMYMMLFCTLLRIPAYLRLMQETVLLRRMSEIMHARPIFTSMVKNAISYAMFYMTRIEFGAGPDSGSVQDENVMTADAIAALPVFDDVTPYIPIGIKYLKFNIPWRLDGQRIPVRSDEIGPRINTTMVDGTRTSFNMLADIPWYRMKLVLTGSRYAGCCWIDQRERDYGSLERYVAEHLGSSRSDIDEMVAAYQLMRTDQPCLTLDASDEKADDQLAIIRAIVAKKAEAPLHLRPTDIDIATYCTADEFDDRAAEFVRHLRSYGTVFAVRNKPDHRTSHSWTIIASFLRYTIDFFHTNVSPIRLVQRYMTCYPRAYFDGTIHIGTAEYVCARMSGVNFRYTASMRDPISIMVKSARREGITMLININEQSLLRSWVAQNMPGVGVVFGNVSPKHPFFQYQKDDQSEQSSDPSAAVKKIEPGYSLPWVEKPMTIPSTGREIPVWDYAKANIVPPQQADFVEYVKSLTH